MPHDATSVIPGETGDRRLDSAGTTTDGATSGALDLDDEERDVLVATALAFPHLRALAARIVDVRRSRGRCRRHDLRDVLRTLDAVAPFDAAQLVSPRARLDHNRFDEALSAHVASTRRRAASAGMAMVTCVEAEYPSLLLRLPDPPVLLWTAGDVAVLHAPAVAIVGARGASAAALTTARQLGRELAAAGLTVVSGLARGVDGAAHRGALEAGTTIAVLGTGVDVTYPPEHRELAAAISRRGAVVSELAPGTPPRKRHFPLRNRLVAGLSRGVVIVEAGEKSGALITAREALDQGKEVMVVPGQALSGRNRGGHALVKDGAALVEDAADVLNVLRSAGAFRSIPCRFAAAGSPASESQEPEEADLKGLPKTVPDDAWRPGEEMDLDSLQLLTGLDPAGLLATLLQWELGGHVAATPGGRFVRLSR